MRNTLAIATLAALALTGCAADSATSGVADATGAAVTASPEIADEPDMSTIEPSEEPSENLISTVTIKTCKKGDYGVEIEGTITNPSDEVSDMSAMIEIVDSNGDRVDEAGILESAIKPDQKVNYSSSGMEAAEDLPNKIVCRVLSVDRYPSS